MGLRRKNKQNQSRKQKRKTNRQNKRQKRNLKTNKKQTRKNKTKKRVKKLRGGSLSANNDEPTVEKLKVNVTNARTKYYGDQSELNRAQLNFAIADLAYLKADIAWKKYAALTEREKKERTNGDQLKTNVAKTFEEVDRLYANLEKLKSESMTDTVPAAAKNGVYEPLSESLKEKLMKRYSKSKEKEISISKMLGTQPISAKISAGMHIALTHNREELFSSDRERNIPKRLKMTSDDKRLKMTGDILKFVNDEQKFRDSMREIELNALEDKTELINFLKAVSNKLNEPGQCTKTFSKFIGEYYYLGNLSTFSQIRMTKPGKDAFVASVAETFCINFKVTMEALIASFEDSESQLYDLLDMLSGNNSSLFFEINDKMINTSPAPSTETQSVIFALSKTNLKDNLVAKDQFYRLLNDLMFSEKVGHIYREIHGKLKNIFKYTHQTSLNLYKNVLDDVNKIMETAVDEGFWTYFPGRMNNEVHHFISELQSFAHNTMINIGRNPPRGGIILSIKSQLEDKTRELWRRFERKIQTIGQEYNDGLKSKAEAVLLNLEVKALPHELFKLTDEIIFRSYLKLAQKTTAPFLDPGNTEKLKKFVSKLQQNNETSQLMQTTSQEYPLYHNISSNNEATSSSQPTGRTPHSNYDRRTTDVIKEINEIIDPDTILAHVMPAAAETFTTTGE